MTGTICRPCWCRTEGRLLMNSRTSMTSFFGTGLLLRRPPVVTDAADDSGHGHAGNSILCCLAVKQDLLVVCRSNQPKPAEHSCLVTSQIRIQQAGHWKYNCAATYIADSVSESLECSTCSSGQGIVVGAWQGLCHIWVHQCLWTNNHLPATCSQRQQRAVNTEQHALYTSSIA